MKITVNGKTEIFASDLSPSTLANVITSLGHHPLKVVVEFNGRILSPSLWKTQEVKTGDIIEVVTIVGGGS